MSKELEVVRIDECNEGDVCWIVLKNEVRPVYSTIVKKHKNENAILVMTDMIGFRTVVCNHAFWNDKDAKHFKKQNKDCL